MTLCLGKDSLVFGDKILTKMGNPQYIEGKINRFSYINIKIYWPPPLKKSAIKLTGKLKIIKHIWNIYDRKTVNIYYTEYSYSLSLTRKHIPIEKLQEH